MSRWTAFGAIVAKDARAYYLKPPNVSWGLLFPLLWTGMFLVRSGRGLDDVADILPGVLAVSILFGTTSLLAVTVTFEKKGRSFERLLLAPIPLGTLMVAKTSGAIVFGVANALVSLGVAALVTDLSGVAWGLMLPAIVLLSIASTFLGLFVAVSVSEVFEAQTFSNFFRFPMLFLCGLFFPVTALPIVLQPLAYALPPTYGVDILRAAMGHESLLPLSLDFAVLTASGLALFALSLRNVRRRWIV